MVTLVSVSAPIHLVGFGLILVGWILTAVDPPLRQSPCCDPMASFSTSRDLASPFPIGLLYLVEQPVLYKEIAVTVDENQTQNKSFSS